MRNNDSEANPQVVAAKPHIGWIDTLRVKACMLVVLSHSCDYFVNKFGQAGDDFFWGSIYGSLVRPCVPLFVMISGILLLPVKMDMGSFYKKRFTRIFFPFLIWSTVYAVYPYFTKEYTLTETLKNIAYIPINFTYVKADHLWYLYMLIGLYLFLPILSPWFEKAGKKAKGFFLLIWGYTLFIPYINIVFPQLQGVCDWNAIGTTYYFTGFIGYLMVAHYLMQYNKLSPTTNILIGALLFIVGSIITLYGFDYTAIKAGKPQELFWGFTTINVFMQTMGLFLILKNIHIKGKLFADIAKMSFGIYFVHFVLIKFVTPSIDAYAISTGLKIPIIALIVFILSYILTKLISYIPGSKYIIG